MQRLALRVQVCIRRAHASPEDHTSAATCRSRRACGSRATASVRLSRKCAASNRSGSCTLHVRKSATVQHKYMGLKTDLQSPSRTQWCRAATVEIRLESWLEWLAVLRIRPERPVRIMLVASERPTYRGEMQRCLCLAKTPVATEGNAVRSTPMVVSQQLAHPDKGGKARVRLAGRLLGAVAAVRVPALGRHWFLQRLRLPHRRPEAVQACGARLVARRVGGAAARQQLGCALRKNSGKKPGRWSGASLDHYLQAVFKTGTKTGRPKQE